MAAANYNELRILALTSTIFAYNGVYNQQKNMLIPVNECATKYSQLLLIYIEKSNMAASNYYKFSVLAFAGTIYAYNGTYKQQKIILIPENKGATKCS